ncbi:MAG: hypothetical protein KDD37_02795, partial [Bdellovibrionales bacterium]|nr:hypothetical protein [Bdellovibrionales bacterium]
MVIKRKSIDLRLQVVLILYSTMSLFTIRPAMASLLECWAAFDEKPAHVTTVLLSSTDLKYPSDNYKGATTPSVEAKVNVIDKDGSRLLVLEKTGDSW